MYAILERATVTDLVTAPTGWVLTDTPVNHDGGSTAVYEKVAGASEPSTYTWNWAFSSRFCGAIQRVTGANTTTPTAGKASTTSASTIDPPNADPGSSADHLALVFVGQEGKATTFTISTSYTENVDGFGTSGGGAQTDHCSGYIESRQYTGQAENPGVVGASRSDGNGSFTVIVAPSSVDHTETVTDDADVTDDTAAAKNIPRTVTDDAGVTDDTTPAKAIIVTISDDAGATDDTSAAKAATPEVTEAIGVTDDTSRVAPATRTITDPVGVTDDTTRVAPAGRTITEPVAVTDDTVDDLSGAASSLPVLIGVI